MADVSLNKQLKNLRERFNKETFNIFYSGRYTDKIFLLYLFRDYEFQYIRKMGPGCFLYNIQAEELFNLGPQGVSELAFQRLGQLVSKTIDNFPYKYFLFDTEVAYDKNREVITLELDGVIVNESRQTNLRRF